MKYNICSEFKSIYNVNKCDLDPVGAAVKAKVSNSNCKLNIIITAM